MLEIESAEAETTILEFIPETAPQTADTALFLSIPTLCSVITLYLISKRRAK